MRRRPEARAHVVGRLRRQLLHVLLELPALVTPRVIRVALLEADLGQRRHHRRLRERLGEPDDIRVRLRHVGDEPLPELDRLRVRIVDAEDLHAVIDPYLHHPTHLGVDARRVVVEIERVDVLVLLRRVLRVGDRAVRPRREPFGVARDPRVIGRALQGDVHRHLEAEPLRLRDEEVEVLEGAQRRLDRVVPAVLAPDRVRGARILRAGVERVVRPLAVDRADRVDRGEVDDVEAHVGDGGQALGGGAQCAGDPFAGGLVVVAALGAREELVPRPVERALALDEPRVVGARAHVLAQRALRELPDDLRGRARGETGGRRTVLVAQRRDRVAQEALRGLGALLVQRPLEHPRALFEHEVDVDAGLDLDRRVVLPRAVGVGPAFDAIGPVAFAVGDDRRLPQREALVRPRQRHDVLPAGGVGEDDVGVDRVVALAEDLGRQRDLLADDGLEREVAAFDQGGDGRHGDAPERALAAQGAVRPGRPRRRCLRIGGCGLRCRRGHGCDAIGFTRSMARCGPTPTGRGRDAGMRPCALLRDRPGPAGHLDRLGS